MRSLCFLVSFLVLCHNTMGVDVVQQSCKTAADGNKKLNYNFCVSTLNADPKSKGADLKGLTGIMLDLTAAKATSVKSTIAKLKTDPKVDKLAIQDCEKLYSGAISGLKDVTKAFESGDYGTAQTYLSATLNAPDTCETGFQEKKAKSPLTKENGDFSQLNIISLAFISQLRAKLEI